MLEEKGFGWDVIRTSSGSVGVVQPFEACEEGMCCLMGTTNSSIVEEGSCQIYGLADGLIFVCVTPK